MEVDWYELADVIGVACRGRTDHMGATFERAIAAIERGYDGSIEGLVSGILWSEEHNVGRVNSDALSRSEPLYHRDDSTPRERWIGGSTPRPEDSPLVRPDRYADLVDAMTEGQDADTAAMIHRAAYYLATPRHTGRGRRATDMPGAAAAGLSGRAGQDARTRMAAVWPMVDDAIQRVMATDGIGRGGWMSHAGSVTVGSPAPVRTPDLGALPTLPDRVTHTWHGVEVRETEDGRIFVVGRHVGTRPMTDAETGAVSSPNANAVPIDWDEYRRDPRHDVGADWNGHARSGKRPEPRKRSGSSGSTGPTVPATF